MTQDVNYINGQALQCQQHSQVTGWSQTQRSKKWVQHARIIC